MTLRAVDPRPIRELERPFAVLGRTGDIAVSYAESLAGIPYVFRYYREDSFDSSPR